MVMLNGDFVQLLIFWRGRENSEYQLTFERINAIRTRFRLLRFSSIGSNLTFTQKTEISYPYTLSGPNSNITPCKE